MVNNVGVPFILLSKKRQKRSGSYKESYFVPRVKSKDTVLRPSLVSIVKKS